MTTKYTFWFENLDSNEGLTEVVFPLVLSGDLLEDSEKVRVLVGCAFNLWSDKYQTELLATSEI